MPRPSGKRRSTRKKPHWRGFLFLLKRRAKKNLTKKYKKETLKPSDLRRRKQLKQRNMLIMKLTLAAAAVVALVVLVWFAARAEAVTIKAVDVRGAEAVNPESVESLVFEETEGSLALLLPRRNTFFARLGRIEESIATQFLRIERVNILRKGLDELIVVVEERSPSVVFCGATDEVGGASLEGCFLADKTGLIYGRVVRGSEPQLLKIFVEGEVGTSLLGNTLLSGEEIVALIDLVHMLEGEEVGISEMYLLEDDSLELQTEGGYALLVNIKEDYTDEVVRLLSVLSADVFNNERSLDEVYEFDMRFGRKVFYRFNEDKEEVEEGSEVSTIDAETSDE